MAARSIRLAPRDVGTRAEQLYARYAFPDWLREHSRLVAAVAHALATARAAIGDSDVDVEAVTLGAYLHDIGRSPLVAGDARDHTELGALILAAEGLDRYVELARRHAIYTVLDQRTAPRTMAEKLVYVADRRGGMTIQSLEERAKDTAARHPRYADDVRRAIPRAKEIEREVFAGLPFGVDDLAAHVNVPR